jgi:hypothetical protein
MIISQTLCKESSRATCEKLLKIIFREYSHMQLDDSIVNQTLITNPQSSESIAVIKANEKDANISEMSDNSVRDELNYEDFSPQFITCNIIYKDQSGTGAIYGYKSSEGMLRILFITCNQVLNISDVKEIVGVRAHRRRVNIFTGGPLYYLKILFIFKIFINFIILQY